ISLVAWTIFWVAVASLPTFVIAQTTPPLDQVFTGPYASWISVRTYGALGDGTTDDTAALQAALNALKSSYVNHPSNVLYFPSGTYKITAQLATDRSSDPNNDFFGVELVGQDPANTTIKWAGPSGGTMLSWDAWYDKIRRLTFDGSGLAYYGILRAGRF